MIKHSAILSSKGKADRKDEDMKEDNSFAKYEDSDVWTKEEYASIHWEGIKDFINTLDSEGYWDDLSKMTQLVGYVEAYFAASRTLKHDYEI